MEDISPFCWTTSELLVPKPERAALFTPSGSAPEFGRCLPRVSKPECAALFNPVAPLQSSGDASPRFQNQRGQPYSHPVTPLQSSGDASPGFQNQSGQPYSRLVTLLQSSDDASPGFQNPGLAALFALGKGVCVTYCLSHLWCNTYRSLGGQHLSRADLFHVLTSRQRWGTKLKAQMDILCELNHPF